MGAESCLLCWRKDEYTPHDDAAFIVQITVFLPCRAGSERIKNKNTRLFGKYDNGLIQLKLDQLDGSIVDNVVVSTNDPKVMDLAKGYPKVRLHIRDESLCRSDTSTDKLIPHALELIPTGHILWTHVTSPFVGSMEYNKIIGQYKSSISEGFDSLMTMTEIKAFLWQDGPLNYSRDIERWPQTQTIKPVYKINSAAFLAPVEAYKNGDRIGINPYLYLLDEHEGFDIDYPVEFDIAEQMM